jgi:hypothetical protein
MQAVAVEQLILEAMAQVVLVAVALGHIQELVVQVEQILVEAVVAVPGLGAEEHLAMAVQV